jgi:hypothetical protein
MEATPSLADADGDPWDDPASGVGALSYQEFAKQAVAFAAASESSPQAWLSRPLSARHNFPTLSMAASMSLRSHATNTRPSLSETADAPPLAVAEGTFMTRSLPCEKVWEWVPPPLSDVRFTLGGGGYLRLRNVAVVRRPRADAGGGGGDGAGDTADRLAGAPRPLATGGGELDELEEEGEGDEVSTSPPPTSPQSRTTPPFSGPCFVLELAEIRRLELQVKEIEQDDPVVS